MRNGVQKSRFRIADRLLSLMVSVRNDDVPHRHL